MKSRELTDEELELVIGGQTYNQFQLWRIKIINETRADFLKKSQGVIYDSTRGERNVRRD